MADSPMLGPELDRVLLEIYNAEDAQHNGKVVYIRNGSLSFEDGGSLFDVVTE